MNTDKLCIVIPVYNEEKAIGNVLRKWAAAMDALGIAYTLRPYDDGSRDRSLNVMEQSRQTIRNLDIRHKANSGHGPTILQGYADAINDGFDWIFQIDSDDEMGPEQFSLLWEKRHSYDFIVGRRAGRRQATSRKLVSRVSRLAVRACYGKSAVWDVNAPYRLMRTAAFRDILLAIPPDTFAPNVIITGMAAKNRLRAFEIPVPQHERTTGEVSIRKWRLAKASIKSLVQTIAFALFRSKTQP